MTGWTRRLLYGTVVLCVFRAPPTTGDATTGSTGFFRGKNRSDPALDSVQSGQSRRAACHVERAVAKLQLKTGSVAKLRLTLAPTHDSSHDSRKICPRTMHNLTNAACVLSFRRRYCIERPERLRGPTDTAKASLGGMPRRVFDGDLIYFWLRELRSMLSQDPYFLDYCPM